MTKTRVGINGFGRIGRCTFKQLVADERFEVAGFNDLADIEELAYLLKYDSVHGWYPRKVETDGKTLVVDGQRIQSTSERDPGALPWGELGVDVVIEATGALRSRSDAAGHLAAGATRVIISAPSDGVDATLVYGVNHESFDRRRAFLFVHHTSHLPIGQARQVCAGLVEDAGRWTSGQLTERIRKALYQHEPR